MDRIRPSLKDLEADTDYDQLAFPELDGPSSVRASRVGAPRVLSTSSAQSATQPRTQSTSVPGPVPVPPRPSSPPPAPAPAPKPKSRFALQREREAAERAAAAAAGGDSGAGALPKSSGAFSLIGNVIERTSTGPPLPPSAPGPSAPSPLAQKHAFGGFPTSSHMGFPRKAVTTDVTPTPSAFKATKAVAHDEDDEEEAREGGLDGLLKSVSKDNERVLSGMSEEDILEEQRQIRESLGLSPEVLRMLEARANKTAPPPPPAMAAAKEKKKKVAFAHPPSTVPTTRPAPAGAPAPKIKEMAEEDLEEGSPEYIRRHFFPNEPRSAVLDWMREPSLAPLESQAVLRTTFDLAGNAVGSSAASESGAAGADHHHGSSSDKFTLPALMQLTSSSVPSQRSSAFLVLARVFAHEPSHEDLVGKKEWADARLGAATLAGQALALPNKNVGVQAAAINLLAVLLPEERNTPPPPEPSVSGAEPAPTLISSLLAWDPLDSLANALVVGALPHAALSQILDILDELLNLDTRLTTASDGTKLAEKMLATPQLLEAISNRFLALSWPPAPGQPTPRTRALSFLTSLARTSRAAAKAIVDRNLHEHPLRFLAMAPWDIESPAQRALGYELLLGSFALWETLARYGLGARLWTQGTALFTLLNSRLDEGHKEDETVRVAWLSLLAVWTTAAVDPHVSGHDILWSQVQGWELVVLSALDWAWENGVDRHAEVVGAGWGLLVEWLEGSKVNRPWRGEEERAWILANVGKHFAQGEKGRMALVEALERGDEALVLAAVRLSDAYEEDSSPKTGPLVEWTQGELAGIFASTPGSWYGIRLRVALFKRVESVEDKLRAIVELLPLLRAGDEVAARDLMSSLTATLSTANQLSSISSLSTLDKTLEVPSLSRLDLLRPFLTHALVRASGGRVSGPLHPTSKDLRLTASLPTPASFDVVLSKEKTLLRPTWPLAALDELLRSATSLVFQQLPPNWPGTELQLVQASLALLRATQLLGGGEKKEEGTQVDAAELVYELVKVFMLEKDHPNQDSGAVVESDLFRDPSVAHSIGKLLDSISLGTQITHNKSIASAGNAVPPLEVVSARVSTAPLFQLYSDLLGLYGSISLGDKLFGRILLPFLRTEYAVDYKRLLWVDQAELLRSLQTTVRDTVSDESERGVGAWLYPAEEDEVLLLAYADALVKGRVDKEKNELLCWIATHHLAMALFEGAPEPRGEREKRVARLANALVQPGRKEVLLRLIKYGQGQGEEIVLPPGCYELNAGEEVVKARVERLRGMLDEAGRGRLDELEL